MNNKEQYIINFPIEESYSKTDFMVTEANRQAYELVLNPEQWNNCCLILSGEPGAGKTHLAHIWAHEFDAKFVTLESQEADFYVVDGLKKWLGSRDQEEYLFHLYNHCLLEGKKLLIISETAPSHLSFKIKDLQSRMVGATMICLNEPDDQLLYTVFYKLCSDHQLVVDEAAANYIIMRAERSIKALRGVVSELNKRALSEKRKLTVPFVRKILETHSHS